jgi:hypothetical protein
MKKIISILIIITCGLILHAQPYVYYVATDGDDTNPGTISEPWGTWQKGFETAQAGDTVYFRGGVYYPAAVAPGSSSVVRIDVTGAFGPAVGHSGTYENPIHFFNYPGENPILDCHLVDPASNYVQALSLSNTHHLYLRGLTFRNVYQRRYGRSAQGISTYICSNLKFERIDVNNISGRGWWVTSLVGHYGIEYDTTYFINCDTYGNVDTFNYYIFPADTTFDEFGEIIEITIDTMFNPGNSADGWKIAGYPGGIVIFDGCRSFNNSDDGYDWSGPGLVIFKNTWAFNNGRMSAGDGNGFKIGGQSDTISYPTRIFTNCISAGNRNSGIQDIDAAPSYRTYMHVYNTVFYDNDYGLFGGTAYSNPEKPWLNSVWRNNIIYKVGIDPNFGNDKIGTYGAGFSVPYDVQYCTWINTPSGHPYNIYNPAYTVTDDDFVSLDISELAAARQSDGSLPVVNFMRLEADSDLKEAGTYVGMSATPDIGLDYLFLDGEINSTLTDILTFIISGQTGSATINNTNHTIAIEVAYGTNVTSLSPTITLSYGATISPTSGMAMNFTSPVTYTVTALDEVTTQEWTVTVTVADAPTVPSAERRWVRTANGYFSKSVRGVPLYYGGLPISDSDPEPIPDPEPGEELSADLQDDFIFLWQGEYTSTGALLSEINSNDSITITDKDWATTYIPYNSEATLSFSGSKFLNADAWDGVWFADNNNPLPVSPWQLAHVDFSSTLVRYDTLMRITWIGILHPDSTITASKWDQLHSAFNLSVFHSGTYNEYGELKENKGFNPPLYKGWLSMLDSLDMTHPSNATKQALSRFCVDVSLTGADSIIERMWMFALNDTSLVRNAGSVSIAYPSENRATFPTAITMTVNGFSGNGSDQYVSTNFNPTADGEFYGLNQGSRIVYTYGGSASGAIEGCAGPSGGGISMQNNGLIRFHNSSVGASGSYVFNALNRINSSTVQHYYDSTSGSTSDNATSMPNEPITLLRNAWGYGSSTISFYLIGGAMSSTQVTGIRTAINTYINNL